MGKIRKRLLLLATLFFAVLHIWIVASFPLGATGTAFTLLPACVVIVVALITREVFLSLIAGVISGAVIVCSSGDLSSLPRDVLLCIVGGNGNEMGLLDVLSDSWNMGIMIFFLSLGVVVDLVNRCGGRAAFTRALVRRVKNRRGALLSTIVLGCVLFVDDYLNCLIVGTSMRPITDTHKVSRAKLAYLVDSTASPVCMLMPLSSWVAAVSGYVGTDKVNGVDLFFKQIPYNFYCILTLLMVVLISLTNIDFGPMLKHERNAQLNNDVFSSTDRPFEDAERNEVEQRKGSAFDFIIPVLALAIFSLFGILYTGGIFNGQSFLDSFAAADASKGLALGGVSACCFVMLYLRLRRSVSVAETMSAIPNGIKLMAFPIGVLVFAWLFGGIARNGLDMANFFGGILGNVEGYIRFLPAIVFLIAAVLAFATGTSWGTIAIIAPIVVSIMDFGVDPTTCVIGLSAVCGGAVCGDHSSPISDTSVMASTGSHCSLMEHIMTQLPYALLVLAVSFVGYLLTSFVESPVVCLFMTVVLLWAALMVIKSVVSAKHLGLLEEMDEANGSDGDKVK